MKMPKRGRKKPLEFLSLNDAYPISVSNTCVAKVKPSWFFLSTTLLSEKVTPASFPLKTSVIRSQKHKQHITLHSVSVYQ